MTVTKAAPALHWRCPSCGLRWTEQGHGFEGSRFSECLRCGGHATEGEDGQPTPYASRAEAGRRRLAFGRR